MATVTIGGRDLEVKRSNLGFKKHVLLPWKARARAATTEEEVLDLQVEAFLFYLDGNAGVTADWLLENLPENPNVLLMEIAAAAGQRTAPPGEAKSP